MGRQILEGQHVTRGQRNDGLRVGGSGQFGESLKHGQKIFGCPVVTHNHDQGPSGGLLQQNQQEGLGSRGEPRDTKPTRVLLEVGGYTRKGGQLLYVREEFANER